MTVRANHARRHCRIRKDLFPREASMLTLASFDYTPAYHCRAVSFGSSLTTQFTKLHGRHVDVNIDPIKQWTRDFSDVTLNLIWRTTALACRIVPKAAGARIHRSGEHE